MIFKKVWFLVFLIMSVFGGCDSGPQVEWKKFGRMELDAARESGKPTVVYFYAAWCRPCQQMRSSTFRDMDVIQALDGWNRLKADMSFRENKETIALTREFEVLGLPMLIFYDAGGKSSGKGSGFFSKEKLLEALRDTEKSGVGLF